MQFSKKSSESFVVMTEMVLPNDTNTLTNLMGGRLLYWMDIVAAIAAQRHANSIVVTASVDNVSFQQPIKLGNVVTMEARVTRAFSTSMEVLIEVYCEDIPNQTKFKSNSAFYTFVGVDSESKPKPVPELIPETEAEKVLYNQALQRRQMRLVLAGRLKPSDATELRNLFE
ncbi:MAG TPA: acyl-CoA thioesterase [Cytophagales bacterium]|nr:acyl-CoA thioesterase [Cytophagales bacterium]